MKYYEQKGCWETSHWTYLEVSDDNRVIKLVEIRPDSAEVPITSSNVELVFPEDEIKADFSAGGKVQGGIVEYAGPGVLIQIRPFAYGLLPTEVVLAGVSSCPLRPIHYRVEATV